MGVPALFRWLSKKYPKIVEAVIEAPPNRVEMEDGYEEIPLDTSAPNPNGVEFDNLYLDMNGIVHPCTHPEGNKAPETEEEMMIEIFKYTERVVSMVRPRKLLMIATDGVAPRAKMNQQRSRRFRASQEAKVKEEEKQQAILEWRMMGKEVSDEFKNKKAWDSNAITPGTPFMTLLASSLRYWIVHKMNTDPGWSQMQVVLSDASVPGEGEHKIMDFIRRSRTQAGYDPNTRHVIYGLDADLIMLSLATHEPHFKVLREDVFFQEKKARGCHRCGQPGHHSSQCTGKPKEKAGEHDAAGAKGVERKPFIFLDVATLREYLEIELDIPNVPFSFDFERAIDDWVLLIFFVGNDFLPHLPSLEIREGAIDTLLKIWKDQLPIMGGYLTHNGQLDLKRAQVILQGLAAREDDIFRRRRETEERQDRAEKRRRIERGEEVQDDAKGPASGVDYVEVNSARPVALPPRPDFLPAKPGSSSSGTIAMQSHADIVKNRGAIRKANLDAAAMLKAELAGQLPKPAEEAPMAAADVEVVEAATVKAVAGVKRKIDDDLSAEEVEQPVLDSIAQEDPLHEKDSGDEEEPEDDEDAGNVSVMVAKGPSKPPPLKLIGGNMVEQEDTVKLWEPGYRERYYRQKFGLELSDTEERRKVVKAYVEGLCWVLAYYYQGCPSWQWFYPYHYSPFAADFTELDKLEVQFTLGQPFRPYEQLMGVFPAASRAHIPATYHPLMTDLDSPIIDFYPEDFEIDMNGKKMLWQGVALLPFIEQDRLLENMKEREGGLTEEEEVRNAPGHAVVFLNEDHPQFESISHIYEKKKGIEPIPLEAKTARGLFGFTLPDPDCVPGTTYPSPIPETGLPDIHNDRSISARYYFPTQRWPHKSLLLKGVKYDKRILTSADRETIKRGGSFQPAGQGFHQQRRDLGGPGISQPRSRPPSGNYGGPPAHGGYTNGSRPYNGGYSNGESNYAGGGASYGSHSAYGNWGGGGSGNYPGPNGGYPAGGGGYSQGSGGGYGGSGGYGGYQPPGGYGGYGGPYGGETPYRPPPPPSNSYSSYGGSGYRPRPVMPAHTRPASGAYQGYQPPPPPPPQQQQAPYGGGGRGGYQPPGSGRGGGYTRY